MIPMSLAEIAAVMDGKLSETADPEAIVTGGVEYDSRKAGPGGLFLIPGDKVDGHDFAAKAHAKGALATIATRPIDSPGDLRGQRHRRLDQTRQARRRRLQGDHHRRHRLQRQDLHQGPHRATVRRPRSHRGH